MAENALPIRVMLNEQYEVKDLTSKRFSEGWLNRGLGGNFRPSTEITKLWRFVKEAIDELNVVASTLAGLSRRDVTVSIFAIWRMTGLSTSFWDKSSVWTDGNDAQSSDSNLAAEPIDNFEHDRKTEAVRTTPTLLTWIFSTEDDAKSFQR
jgi:hypothetical protein